MHAYAQEEIRRTVEVLLRTQVAATAMVRKCLGSGFSLSFVYLPPHLSAYSLPRTRLVD